MGFPMFDARLVVPWFRFRVKVPCVDLGVVYAWRLFRVVCVKPLHYDYVRSGFGRFKGFCASRVSNIFPCVRGSVYGA